MRSRPTSRACRRRRPAPPSCSPSAPGAVSPPRGSTATCTSRRPAAMRSCLWCATARFPWGGSRSSPNARPSRRAAGWSSSDERRARGVRQGARPRHPGARGARRDARFGGRRARGGGAADGGHQGDGGGGARGEPRQPAAARHGGGGGRRDVGNPCGRSRGAGRERRPRAPRAAPGRGGGGMTTRAVEAWTLEPLVKFVKEAGVRLVLVMTSAGQVLAQHGFARAVDVMSAAALGAAILASTEQIARELRQPPFAALNHQGEGHGIFLAGVATARGKLVTLVVYDLDVSSLGLVQLFFEQLAADLQAASPKDSVPKQVLAADFERH